MQMSMQVSCDSWSIPDSLSEQLVLVVLQYTHGDPEPLEIRSTQTVILRGLYSVYIQNIIRSTYWHIHHKKEWCLLGSIISWTSWRNLQSIPSPSQTTFLFLHSHCAPNPANGGKPMCVMWTLCMLLVGQAVGRIDWSASVLLIHSLPLFIFLLIDGWVGHSLGQTAWRGIGDR
jgi:hypothetical protein